MTVELKVRPVPVGFFAPGEMIRYPPTGEIVRVTGLRREVVRKLGFGRPRRSHRRPWPWVRYTRYIDLIRGERLP